MVLQDTWLFHGTIRENIAYGRLDATEEEIVAAAEAAHVDHFVRTLPDGYDTVIDDDATNLSAGEKQLLTIARAFLADPPILILDEATSLGRHPHRGPHPARDGAADEGPDDVRHRPPPVDDPRRRHDPRDGAAAASSSRAPTSSCSPAAASTPTCTRASSPGPSPRPSDCRAAARHRGVAAALRAHEVAATVLAGALRDALRDERSPRGCTAVTRSELIPRRERVASARLRTRCARRSGSFGAVPWPRRPKETGSTSCCSLAVQPLRPAAPESPAAPSSLSPRLPWWPPSSRRLRSRPRRRRGRRSSRRSDPTSAAAKNRKTVPGVVLVTYRPGTSKADRTSTRRFVHATRGRGAVAAVRCGREGHPAVRRLGRRGDQRPSSDARRSARRSRTTSSGRTRPRTTRADRGRADTDRCGASCRGAAARRTPTAAARSARGPRE